MATDEILPVTKILKADGDFMCDCPHCGDQVLLGDEDPRGEQFQHRLVGFPDAGCKGWMEIDSNARIVRPK